MILSYLSSLLSMSVSTMNSDVNKFKIINSLEGLSFIILLFIAMPAKHYFGQPLAVTFAGWIHGLLFIAYIMSAYSLATKLKWSERYTISIIIAGMIPFAFLLVNRKLSIPKQSPLTTLQ